WFGHPPFLSAVFISAGSDPAGSGCQVGCATCSLLNGCLSCKPRFFFHLELDGIQQRGTCMSSCPRGHYGMRSPHISTCIKCKVDCASCFSENFCTRCHPGHFLFRGKCESSCPNGLTANALMQCMPQGERRFHCEVGEWTSWGQCVRKQNTTVHRRGEETRTRQILFILSVFGVTGHQIADEVKPEKKWPFQDYCSLHNVYSLTCSRKLSCERFSPCALAVCCVSGRGAGGGRGTATRDPSHMRRIASIYQTS
uniref:R-spondin 3 n=1 Tax=Xiphophorus maculatus TaxID=8083 RepID=A0A3B5QNN9_XIPMA